MKKQGREFDKSKYREWIDPAEVKPYERNAKIHTEKQIENIANSIRRFGWQQDVVITADNVLVIGHGRRLAALKLGCDMPFHRIDKTADALTDEDIRELRIADNQTNAETGNDWDILQAELDGLTFDGFDFGELFGEIESDIENETGEDEDESPYTSKTDIPQYEPSEEGTELSECLDELKYKELLQEIESSGLEDEEKDFLRLAAARHLCFNYKRIADYYASSASAEMQRLMEKSALVIIDYQDAIKNGFVKLSKSLEGIMHHDS